MTNVGSTNSNKVRGSRQRIFGRDWAEVGRVGEPHADRGGVKTAGIETTGVETVPGGERHSSVGTGGDVAVADGLAALGPARIRGLGVWLVNKTAVHSHRIASDAFAAVGGRRFHYALLASLDESGPASQAALGRRCGFDRSDVAALVNELARAGYIERTQDPADRRRNIIAITAAGRVRLVEFDAVAADLQETFLAPLDTQERAELTGLLTRLLAHHTALHGLPIAPHLDD